MAGAMMGQLDNMTGNIGQTFQQSSPAPEKKETVIKCEKCGADLPQNAKFCLECGEKVKPAVPDGMVVCPECNKTVVKGRFCPECGHKFVTVCPKCGNELPAGAKFCLECGEKI